MAMSWEELDNRKMPEWYQKAKFGVFIHWGPYSVPAYRSINDEIFGSYAEWYYATVYGNYRNNGDDFHKRMYGDMEYREFGDMFKAELFDADYIAKLIHDSGAKYMVLTTKHHDGYCLWPTENPHKKGWNSFDIGPKRDLVGELREASLKNDVEFGIYYSIIDWESVPSHRCDGGYFIPEDQVKKYGLSKEQYIEEILQPQLHELVNKYEPCLIYSDGGEWDLTEEESHTKEFLTWLYTDSPVNDKIVVNDRFCVEMPGNHGDYYSTEYQDKQIDEHPFEESRGVGKSYGYNRAERIDDYCTTKQLLNELVRVVSKGGNFLLNIGPMADGTIPIHEVERLTEMGEWLNVCGEAIYDTEAYEGEYKLQSTVKNNNHYVFIKDEMINGNVLSIPMIENVKEIGVLGVEDNCKWEVKDDNISITVVNQSDFYRLLEKSGLIVIKITK